MAVKKEEQFLHPDFLSNKEDVVYSVMRVNNRREKIMMHAFALLKIPYFLPTYKKVKRYKKGTATHEIPLFSNYIFHHHFEDRKSDLFNYSNHFNSMFEIEEGQKPLFFEQMKAISIIMGSGETLDAYSHLEEGALVRVKSGPFKDLEGYIREKRKQYYFVVNLEMLGQSVSVEIDPLHLANV